MPPSAPNFVVARNPEEDSTLPFLLRLPIDGGLLLKARERWPATARVYCHPLERWPEDADVLEEVAVRRCERRGKAVDLVVLAVVERKALEDLTTSLIDGTLAFRMSELAAVASAALAVEGRYGSLHKIERVQPGWAAEVVARLQARYPSVPIVFADSRKLAEDWTYRFLAAALDQAGPTD